MTGVPSMSTVKAFAAGLTPRNVPTKVPEPDSEMVEVSKAEAARSAGDGPKKTDAPVPPKKDGTVPVGQPGAVCTQQNKTCGANLLCAFLEAWNAPKGTCLRELKDGCKSYDDPRCQVPGANYSVMCGEYTVNGVATSICFLLCVMNSKNYDCPPLHTCKLVNGYNVCLPQ